MTKTPLSEGPPSHNNDVQEEEKSQLDLFEDEAQDAGEAKIASVAEPPHAGHHDHATSKHKLSGGAAAVGSAFKNVVKTTVPVSLSYGDNQQQADNDQDPFALQEDIYTLMFIAPFRLTSHAFLYSTFFFLFQVIVIAFITFDLLRDGTDNNFLNVPPAVDLVVSVSQVFALFIAVLTQDDVTTTLYLVSVGYDPNQVPATATQGKWILSNILRFLLGMAIIFLCFVFIVQSTNVIDLFKDFAAVTFVSEVDDAAFQLARRGFFSDELREATKGLEEVHFQELDDTVALSARGCCRKISRNCRGPKFSLRLRGLCLLLVFGAMAGAWGRLYARQKNGDFNPSSLQVQMGDETFEELHYAYFSGLYELKKRDFVGGRPVYYERGDASEQSSGKFFYCHAEGAWVFAVEGATKGNERDDECHWLMRSPNTNGYDLSAESLDNWHIWTGSVEQVGHFILFGADCDRESDCNYHGSCNSNGQCECDAGWLGKFCKFEDTVCDNILFYIADQVISTFSLLLDTNDRAIVVYDRPVYYKEDKNKGQLLAIIYTGRRYYITVWDNVFTTVDELRELLSQPFFHAYWSEIYQNNTIVFSKPTDSVIPAGEHVEWDVVGSSRAVGDFGAFGFFQNVQFTTTHCQEVDCNVPRVCGLSGKCRNGTCVCDEGHTGHFCQYPFLPLLYTQAEVNTTRTSTHNEL